MLTARLGYWLAYSPSFQTLALGTAIATSVFTVLNTHAWSAPVWFCFLLGPVVLLIYTVCPHSFLLAERHLADCLPGQLFFLAHLVDIRQQRVPVAFRRVLADSGVDDHTRGPPAVRREGVHGQLPYE